MIKEKCNQSNRVSATGRGEGWGGVVPRAMTGYR